MPIPHALVYVLMASVAGISGTHGQGPAREADPSHFLKEGMSAEQAGRLKRDLDEKHGQAMAGLLGPAAVTGGAYKTFVVLSKDEKALRELLASNGVQDRHAHRWSKRIARAFDDAAIMGVSLAIAAGGAVVTLATLGIDFSVSSVEALRSDIDGLGWPGRWWVYLLAWVAAVGALATYLALRKRAILRP